LGSSIDPGNGFLILQSQFFAGRRSIGLVEKNQGGIGEDSTGPTVKSIKQLGDVHRVINCGVPAQAGKTLLQK